MKKLTAISVLTSSIAGLSLAESNSNLIDDNQFTGNLTGYLGIKGLDEDEWAPVDSQFAYGLGFDLGLAGKPLYFTAAYINSSDESKSQGTTLKGETTEMRLGLKYMPESHSTVQGYIGGGIANISASFTFQPDRYVPLTIEDSALGAWVGVGFNWSVAKHLTLGGEVSYSIADITFSFPDGASLDGPAGGAHVGLTAGFHW